MEPSLIRTALAWAIEEAIAAGDIDLEDALRGAVKKLAALEAENAALQASNLVLGTAIAGMFPIDVSAPYKEARLMAMSMEQHAALASASIDKEAEE